MPRASGAVRMCIRRMERSARIYTESPETLRVVKRAKSTIDSFIATMSITSSIHRHRRVGFAAGQKLTATEATSSSRARHSSSSAADLTDDHTN